MGALSLSIAIAVGVANVVLVVQIVRRIGADLCRLREFKGHGGE